MKRWTAREEARICRLHARGADTDTIVAAIADRTRDAVLGRIQHLREIGRLDYQRVSWTPEESKLLCELRRRAPDISGTELAKYFPDRTGHAISQHLRQLIREGRIERQRAKKKKYREWSNREEAVLVAMRERAKPATLEQIKLRLPNRSTRAIALRIQQLIDGGVIAPATRAPKTRQSWAEEEDRLLVDLWLANRTIEQIAEALDRPFPSVNNRIARLRRRGALPPRR